MVAHGFMFTDDDFITFSDIWRSFLIISLQEALYRVSFVSVMTNTLLCIFLIKNVPNNLGTVCMEIFQDSFLT